MKNYFYSFLIIIFFCGTAFGIIDPNLEQKIGQMIMVGFRGTDVNDNSLISNDIKTGKVGGIILFDTDVKLGGIRNIQSPAQLKNLTNKLQSMSPISLIIATDQEGGNVSRLKEQSGFSKTVSAKYLGQLSNTKITFTEGSKIASELKTKGINLNLAPIVDLETNPANPVIGKLDRSFSADPNIVIIQAEEFIKAHHKQGILCTLKHFPGHGSSKDDSHLGSVDITNTWTPEELKPYEVIIKDGLADAVMTGHLFNAKLDDKYNATLSKKIVTGLLREKLRFNGVVISDCLHMQAIAANYKFDDAVELSINAGVDIILLTNNSPYVNYDEDIASHTVEIIKNLIKQGKISEDRINQSYTRIMLLKSSIAAKQ